jgi:isopentenyldiphosphate isomerase
MKGSNMTDLVAPRDQPDERLLIVDCDDNVVGEGYKREIHAARLWHRQVYVQIVNAKKEFLLQQRCSKRLFDSLRWTASASGHVDCGESYWDAANRELHEELGLEASKLEFIGKQLAFSTAANEVCGGPSALFVMMADISLDQIHLQVDEVSDVRWFPLQSLSLTQNLSSTGGLAELSEDFLAVLPAFLQYNATLVPSR